MKARSNDGASSTRRLLSEGWEICATAPGECVSPETLESSRRNWVGTAVPNTAAGSMQAAGLWSLDGAERRFDAEDWWYRLRFDFPDEASVNGARFEFDGLATLCEIWLNDVPLLASDNMHLSHVATAHSLRIGTNELHLVFRSLDAALKKRRPRPRWRTPMIEHQQLRWYRTTVLGRTPGWSPPAAPVGPWKPITLCIREDPLEILQLRATQAGDDGVLHFRGHLRMQGVSQLTLELRRQGQDIAAAAAVEEDGGALRSVLHIERIEPWYPHTHGKPALYDVLLSGRDAQDLAFALPLGRVGFRRVEQRTSAPGEYGLIVNGLDIFCRGACWTPLDVVSLQADAAKLRRALEQVVAAGFNMLRISGAFVYEDEKFFRLCDELGILVWQDFMFANMDYPAEDQAFAASVRREAMQQLECWARHPSVAVICGNSEVSQQAAMWGTPRELWQPSLFEETLRQLSSEHCADTPYWPSSACGGDFPHQANAGTVSYYGVGAYLRGFDDLRRSGVRFATECLGFANIPEATTLEALPGGSSIRVHHATWKRRAPRDLGAGWDFDDVRDYYLRALFAIDPLQLRYADHARYLEMSRRASAEVMAAAFTEWRRPASGCHGALVWFLRDLWPGAGWGIIDSLGEPKAPYHALRQLLQSRWVGITDEGLNGLAIHVGNETPEALPAKLELSLYRDAQHLVTRALRDIVVAAHATTTINAGAMLSEFHDLTHAYRFGPLSCDLIVATVSDSANGNKFQAFHLPYPHLHATPSPVCALVAQARLAQMPGQYELTVHSATFARSVHIDVPGYAADMQYFHMAPGTELTVTLRPHPGVVAPPLGSVAAMNSGVASRIEVLA